MRRIEPSSSTRSSFGLQRSGQLANLVDEQRAAVGDFEQARLCCHRACKCPLLVPEQLAFQQGFGQRGTVDHYERLIGPHAGSLQSLGHELFPRAAFALNENRLVRAARTLDRVETPPASAAIGR